MPHPCMLPSVSRVLSTIRSSVPCSTSDLGKVTKLSCRTSKGAYQASCWTSKGGRGFTAAGELGSEGAGELGSEGAGERGSWGPGDRLQNLLTVTGVRIVILSTPGTGSVGFRPLSHPNSWYAPCCVSAHDSPESARPHFQLRSGDHRILQKTADHMGSAAHSRPTVRQRYRRWSELSCRGTRTIRRGVHREN